MDKVALVDLDGTIYEGNKLIEGAIEAIDNLKSNGFKVFFCTNNSSLPPEKIANKLRNMGMICSDEDIISSIMITLFYIKENKLNNIYLCGSDSVIRYFSDNDIPLCKENECDNLIIAMDSDFNYEKMTRGIRAALHSKKIIVCNQDRLFPTENGLCPGCGAIASSILFASRKEPDLIIGKPQINIMDYVANKYRLKPDEIVVIGDGIDSDVAMANAYGSKSILIGKDVKTIKDTANWSWSKII